MNDTPKRQAQPDAERIREVTRIVVSVLEEWQLKGKKPASRFSRTVDWLNDHWALLAALIAGSLTILYFFLAWRKGVDFLHPVTQIVNEQTKSNQEIHENAEKEKTRQLLRRVVECRLQCGKNFLNTGLYEEAKAEFEAALKLDKTNMEAELGLLKSRVFELSQGDYNPEVIGKRIEFIAQESKKDCNKESIDPHVFLFRGAMHYAVEEFDKAEENFRRALKLDGALASAHHYLGLIYDKDKRKDAALKEFEDAVALSNWNRSYLNNLGCEYYEKGKYEEAIKTHKKVIALDPAYLLPYAEISRSLRLTGDLKESEKQLRTLLGGLESEIGLSKKNNKPWYFITEKGDKISFYSLKEKQGYAYYALAVTLYLGNQETKALDLVKLAPKLSPYGQNNLLNVVYDELILLGKTQPSYAPRCNQFRQKLFSQMQREKPLNIP